MYREVIHSAAQGPLCPSHMLHNSLVVLNWTVGKSQLVPFIHRSSGNNAFRRGCWRPLHPFLDSFHC